MNSRLQRSLALCALVLTAVTAAPPVVAASKETIAMSVGRLLEEGHYTRQKLNEEISKKFAIGNHRRGKRVTPDWTIKLAFNPGNILDVIDMPMCEEQKFEIDTKRTQPFASAFGRVEENPALWRLNQIAIRFKNAAAKALVIHGNSLYAGVATAEGGGFYEY